MSVDWEREAPRLARLARLRLAPDEAHELAAACDAITRDFSALAGYAEALPPAAEEPPAPLRPDETAPAPPDEVEGILRAVPRFDARTRLVVVPKGLP